MQKKIQVLLVHGGMTFKNERDYLHYLKTKKVSTEKKIYWAGEYLEKSLGKRFEVISPRMPLQDNAKYRDWKILLERYISLLKGEFILIGSSLGGVFLAKYLESRGIVVDTNEKKHYWKTHKFDVGKRRGGLLLYPLLHVMFAVHSAEYLADHCLDIERIYRHTKKRLLKKYKGGKIIEFD